MDIRFPAIQRGLFEQTCIQRSVGKTYPDSPIPSIDSTLTLESEMKPALLGGGIGLLLNLKSDSDQ